MKFNIVVMFLLALCSPSTWAMSDCAQGANDTEVLNCSTANKAQAEESLNKAYAQAKKRIASSYQAASETNKAYQQVLLDSQRGWLKYRDGQCKIEAYLAETGSNVNLDLANQCITRLDLERIKQLQAIPYE
ncbi:lysozyme inhibitor LprI family protein [Franconibacter daqui]|uniref:lysozyme inhibitor LprI family protein n=1 Tax=Franconibacter daqui TaxID=2047724 RepID=UPI0030CD9B82